MIVQVAMDAVEVAPWRNLEYDGVDLMVLFPKESLVGGKVERLHFLQWRNMPFLQCLSSSGIAASAKVTQNTMS